MANKACSREVALMTLEILLFAGQKSKKVRALLDGESQKSYALKSTAEELGLHPISSETIAHTLFGYTQTKAESHNKFQIEMSAPGKHQQNILDQEKFVEAFRAYLKNFCLKNLV